MSVLNPVASEKSTITKDTHVPWEDISGFRHPWCPGWGGGYSLIRAIWVCAAPKGMVFQPFWS